MPSADGKVADGKVADGKVTDGKIWLRVIQRKSLRVIKILDSVTLHLGSSSRKIIYVSGKDLATRMFTTELKREKLKQLRHPTLRK